MKYVLADIDPRMIDAWKLFFQNEENVTILHADITKLKCDAIVSPANSFGFMDGGVDYAISQRLGWELQSELQERIKDLPEGELLIGKSLVMKTGDGLIPFLIVSPTMRVPMSFNIDTSINAYLAMKATMIVAQKNDEISTVAISGFCTGVGKMSPIVSARQMYNAFVEIEKGEKMNFKNFAEAQKYHWNINPQGRINE